MNDDELDNMTNDLIERYMAHLRGRGPEPDLSVLPPSRQAAIVDQFRIIAALADRDIELPPLEEDPVAVRLGLIDVPVSPTIIAPREPANDALETRLIEMASRFDGQVAVDVAPLWARDTPTGLRPVAECSALGEVVAVFVTVRDDDHPDMLGPFLGRYPNITAVSLVSPDAEHAAVVYPGDVHGRIDPVRGWIPPTAIEMAEPLALSLGRLFERCLPDWHRTATLDDVTGDADLHVIATYVSQRELGLARLARPRLAYKKSGVQALQSVDAAAIADLVIAVQSGNLTDTELLSGITGIAEAAAA